MAANLRLTAVAALLSSALPVFAQDAPTLAPVVVTATGIPYNDAEATYASEVHTREMIVNSGATTLYDYLAQHTSLTVMPNYGNKAAPLIDMRGYGGNGYQNIAVSVDGQRLNNIDMTGPLIGAIPLDSIESIEISKGSGSVVYGDGAMAGAIQIHTKAYTGVKASVTAGSYGYQAGSMAAGLSKELFDLSFSAGHDTAGGTSDADGSGHRDSSDTRTENARFALKPNADLKLFLEGSDSHLDLRYPGSLTLAQFNANPGQYPGWNYTHQIFDSHSMKIGGEYKLNSELKLSYTHGAESKESDYVGSSPYSYDISTDDLSLSYRGRDVDFTGGISYYDGTRNSSAMAFSKDNAAAYLQGAYRIGLTTLSAGVRRENVSYNYLGSAGTNAQREYDLDAWELGVNHRFTEMLSVFANLNSAYEAPDIDRFFTLDPSTYQSVFSGFIEPAKAKTLNAGFNLDTRTNRLRVAMFHSNLHNEIYYQATSLYTGFNTNIDKSHKYGLELQDTWQMSRTLSFNGSYTYTRAIIDEASQSSGAYNGKNLPGVPRHGVTLGSTWLPWADAKLNLSHVWRSWSYAADDMSNSAIQHQAAYQSTNLSLRQRWGKTEGFVGIENLFAHKNGIWVDNDTIYPVDFQRLVKIGVKVEM